MNTPARLKYRAEPEQAQRRPSRKRSSRATHPTARHTDTPYVGRRSTRRHRRSRRLAQLRHPSQTLAKHHSSDHHRDRTNATTADQQKRT